MKVSEAIIFSGIVTKRYGDLLTVACEVMPAVFSFRGSENEYFLSSNIFHKTFHSFVLVMAH